MMAKRTKRALPHKPALASSLNLARSRQARGISLEQIAEATKISIRFLRAIEEDDFEKLPGGIFNTSYLRQYAAATGLEEARLLAHYDRKMNPQPHPENGTARPDRSLFDRWFRVPAQAPPQ
jgi:cytoskeletal protein RodZ